MVSITTKDGSVVEAELDIGRVLAYEAEHPEWSLFDTLGAMGDAKKLRFTDIDLLAKLVGFEGIEEATNLGVSMQDIAEVISKSPILGFTASDKAES